jgi:ABC-2 type transport system ATP-binding protein
MGLIGPNGAGKTTIIKLIMNLVRRDAGSIRLFGLETLEHETAVKARVGFVYEVPPFHEDASLRDLGAVIRRFYRSWDDTRFRTLSREFELPLGKKFKKLSHGMKTKFALAVALCHDADFILMDEPTSGLDPVFRRELLEQLSVLLRDGGKTILFSTHLTSDLEQIADSITMLHQGELVFSCSRDEIRDNWAIVRGGNGLLSHKEELGFLGYRRTEVAVEALTSDAEQARRRLPDDVVVERASLEDIVYFVTKGAHHA